MPPISSRFASIDVDAMALGVPDDEPSPMPSAGMRAISDICNQAAASAAALSRAAATGGLGNLIGGNYTPVAPPVQRITDMNNSGLAGLGALGGLGTSAGSVSSGGGRASVSPPSETSGSEAPSSSAGTEAVHPEVPAETAPVADAPADVPADAPAGDTGASTAETSSADEETPVRPRRGRASSSETSEVPAERAFSDEELEELRSEWTPADPSHPMDPPAVIEAPVDAAPLPAVAEELIPESGAVA